LMPRIKKTATPSGSDRGHTRARTITTTQNALVFTNIASTPE
jgi:hypothetical protein